MKVILAKNSGFCAGVKRAVETALSLEGDNLFVLGEIVHNPQVIKEISERGIKCVQTTDELPEGCTVLFRSHGVPENYYDICKERNIKVVDCTCANVKRTQKIIKEQYGLGRQIVIIGKPDHPEVEGLKGWCGDSAVVLDDGDDIPADFAQKELSVVCQTTFSVQKFEKIIKNIKKVCEKTVAVFKTICYTTIERQKEVEMLSQSCDTVIVLGGLNSSNTNKLYDIAKVNCAKAIRLSSAEEFDFTELKI